MWRRLARNTHQGYAPSRDLDVDIKPSLGHNGQAPASTWFEPGWRATTAAGAILLSACLLANIIVLIWASARPVIEGAPAADDNPVLFSGSCAEVNTIKTWSHLAINIVSTLILSTSTVCMQCLSAPTRDEIDKAHQMGRWMDVGLLSTRNLRHIHPTRLCLYLILGLSSIPLHVLYNSVIFTTLGTYDSMTIVAANDFTTSPVFNQTHMSWLYGETANFTKGVASDGDFHGSYTFESTDNFVGAYGGTDPWSGSIQGSPMQLPAQADIDRVIGDLAAGVRDGRLQKHTIADCISTFSSSPLTGSQNVVLVTTKASNSNGSVIDIDFTLAPGRGHWTCNQPDWMYNSTMFFFSYCPLANPQRLADRGSVASIITDPIPSGYFAVDSCYYEDVTQRCTLVFAKWFMLAVVMANITKLAAMVCTLRFLDFKPLITVGDMLSSFLRDPDPYTKNIKPISNVGIRDARRFEISRIYGLEHTGLTKLIGPKAQHHERLMHQHEWVGKFQRWRNAASVRRWSVTMTLWGLAILAGVAFIAVEGANVWEQAWALGIGDTSPDHIIPGVSGVTETLLSQVILSNLPQLLLSTVYVFYSGLLTTMLSAWEMAGYATDAKPVRVSPPRKGAQRSTYFLQVPWRFAVPTLVCMALLHWLLSQAMFLVRLDEFDILGNLKAASFESVIGYSLRGTFASTITAIGMFFFPIFLGFFKLPAGIPLVGNNSIAISIACHPLADEPEKAEEKALKYGRITGLDQHGRKRTRIGFSAGDVEPLRAGDQIEEDRCLSSLLFVEHGVKDKCTLDRDSSHLFQKILNKGGVKLS